MQFITCLSWMMILFIFMMYNAVKSHLKFSIINELIGGGNP
jgi:hypothetical protein